MNLVKQNFTFDFVKCLIERYGYDIQKPYRKIAEELKVISHSTVQHHILKLERMGIITIENKGSKTQILHISANKLNEAVKIWQQD